MEVTSYLQKLSPSVGGTSHLITRSVPDQFAHYAVWWGSFSLRKHAYSNILKILQPKKGKFSVKKR